MACLLVTFAICGARSHRAAEPIARWVESGEPADPRMVKLVLRQPLQQTIISSQAWALSALAFGVLNAFFSPALGALVGVAILLGGVTTCGMLYLLAEKSLAPITAAALSSAAPRKPALPGVDARVLVTFAVATAGPLLAMAALAIAVLSDITVSSSRLALTMLVLALVALFSGLLAMKLVARSLALSLRSMRDAVARVEQGDLSADVKIYDGSELGVLQAGFNRMVAGLREREQLRDLFGRHVGEHVAREALARGSELGGQQRHAAVLFVDVIGSTSLAAERDPDDVLRLLNRFFGLVVEVVGGHGGWVNKFEGDGALCVFGAPDRPPRRLGLRPRRRARARRAPARRAAGAAGRNGRLRGHGGGRQRGSGRALRVHGDRRPGERGRAAHAAREEDARADSRLRRHAGRRTGAGAPAVARGRRGDAARAARSRPSWSCPSSLPGRAADTRGKARHPRLHGCAHRPARAARADRWATRTCFGTPARSSPTTCCARSRHRAGSEAGASW